MSEPTEEDILDQMRISKVMGPHYVGPQAEGLEPHWKYEFAVEIQTATYRFPVAVAEAVPENQRDRMAVENFKKIVSVIAKKVAAW